MRASVASAMEDLTEPTDTPFVHTEQFNLSVGAVIILNAITIGFEEDLGDEAPELFTILEHLFCILFLVEFILRFYTDRLHFFFDYTEHKKHHAILVPATNWAAIHEPSPLQQLGEKARQKKEGGVGGIANSIRFA